MKLNPNLKIILPIAAVGAAVILFAHVVVQQNYRQTANDPQIQLAEDAAASLDRGSRPDSVLNSSEVDVAKSLAPFIIVFDKDHKVVAANAKLSGQVPVPPAGTFDAAKGLGPDNENRFTWQPRPHVRLAAVIVRHDGGYVLAARSLREVETREAQLTYMTLLALALLLAGSATAALLYLRYK
jgi:hypothetical protein